MIRSFHDAVSDRCTCRSGASTGARRWKLLIRSTSVLFFGNQDEHKDLRRRRAKENFWTTASSMPTPLWHVHVSYLAKKKRGFPSARKGGDKAGETQPSCSWTQFRVWTTSDCGCVRRGSATKDRSAELFWVCVQGVTTVCKLKAQHSARSPRKIHSTLSDQGRSVNLSDLQVKRHHVGNIFWGEPEKALFYRSSEINVAHQKCLSKEELIEMFKQSHKVDHLHSATLYDTLRPEVDHLHSDTLYDTLRLTYYPIVRETVMLLFKKHVNCEACCRQAPLPKTSLVRKTIKATYPNSCWQKDLKTLPSCRGCEYACNIVDYYSRFAMGGPIESKFAKAVCEVVVDCMQHYGPPRILQTNNGKDFNNLALAEVVDEMKARKLMACPTIGSRKAEWSD